MVANDWFGFLNGEIDSGFLGMFVWWLRVQLVWVDAWVKVLNLHEIVMAWVVEMKEEMSIVGDNRLIACLKC